MRVQVDGFPFLQGLLDPFLRGKLDTSTFPPSVIQFLKKMASRRVGTPMSYVDEAGHARDPNRKIFCMGGLLGTETDWRNFDTAWVSACDEEGLTEPFSAKYLAHFKRQFQGWADQRRQHLLRKLIGAIRKACLIPMGSVVYTPDFGALERWQMRGTKLELKDPHFLAFQQVTRMLAFAADHQDYARPLTMIYAHHPEHSGGRGGVRKLWEAMGRNEPHFISAFMGKYACEEPKNEPRLQAADLFAYELGHHFEVVRPAGRKPRWPFKQFVEMGLDYNLFAHDFITYSDAEGNIAVGWTIGNPPAPVVKGGRPICPNTQASTFRTRNIG
jgi:hypothetical protein